MRRRLLFVGLIVLLVGAVTVGAGFAELRSSLVESSGATQLGADKYASSEIQMAGPSVLTVEFSQGVGGLVPANMVGSVNRTNLGQLSVKPNNTSGGVYSYINITGNYYFVVFSNSTPTITWLVTPIRQAAPASAALLGGALLGFVGLVVTILGLVLKPKTPQQ